VGLKSLKSLNLTNGYPNKNKKNNNNNKVKSKPLELFELAGKKELRKSRKLKQKYCARGCVISAKNLSITKRKQTYTF
jgi:hypothetical protein